MGRIWWVIPSGIVVIFLFFIGFAGINLVWPPSVWLALVVTIIVFLVNFVGGAFFGVKRKTFTRVIPSAGILWFSLFFYSSLALAGAAVSVILPFSLILGVAYEMVLLICLGLAFVASSAANKHAVTVQQEQVSASAVLTELRSEIGLLSSRLSDFSSKHPDIEKDWVRIRDDVRYMAPVNSGKGRSIEDELMAVIRRISDMTAAGATGMSEAADRELDDSVRLIGQLLKLRKGFFEADDSQGGF